MLLKNISALLGKELSYKETTSIKIQDGKFLQISPDITDSSAFDCEGLIAIPGFVNMHTHIGDSIAKDHLLSASVDSKIHPVFGAKRKILKNSSPTHLQNFMKNSCQSMIANGITTFVDFREGGLDGVLLLNDVISKIPIRSIILGRAEFYQSPDEIKKNLQPPKKVTESLDSLLKSCDGIGISGANENSDSTLKRYSKTKKIRAIHSAETAQSYSVSKKMTKKSEVTRALQAKPHFLVHMTFANSNDLKKTSKLARGIVVCPRANASLAEGIPDVQLMTKSGCTVAIGTDNVMINSPDMFREMDYLWKVSMAIHKKRIDPKQILKMATVNASKILAKKIGIISKGFFADCILIEKHSIDLEPMHDPHASLVHRATSKDIRAVIIGGKIVHGKI